MKDSKIKSQDLEEGKELLLDFDKLSKVAAQSKGVIPVAIQNADTKEVILVAYTNKEALEKSLKTRIATFWSTSRNELWVKGATSGNTFKLVAAYVNCEQNSLLYMVKPVVDGICHTHNLKGKARNCYYRKINPVTSMLENLNP
jgi:phosphoribosyl-AMP cyclohydrolase